MTITERILYKITESGLKPAEIADKTGIDRASFTRWKNKDYKPSLDAIIALSQFFNISTDWLLTGKEVFNSLPKNQSDNDLQELLDLYSQLDPIKQAEFKGELKGYLKAKNGSS